MQKSIVPMALAMLVVALLTVPGSASAAVSKSCVEFRRSIVDLEANSVRPPQWLSLDLHLRQMYERDCIDDPGYAHPAEYWYRSDGSTTGVPSTADRPGDGAYATTEAHGTACAGTGNPGMCALALDVQDAEGKVAYDPADALPPLSVTLAGQSFAIGAACVYALQTISVLDGEAGSERTTLRGKLRAALAIQSLQDNCPDLLAALARRLGMAAADSDDPAFRDGIRGLVGRGFDVAVAGKPAVGKPVGFDQGFTRMCQQAERFRNQCRVDQQNMGQVGTKSHSREGQAGAFNDCASLYGQVVGMCQANGAAAPREAKKAPAMSAKCQTLAQSYAGAAKAQDSARSLAAYESLKSSCPEVLDDVAKRTGMALPEAAPAFPTRAMGGLTQDVMGGCVAAADSCTGAADAAAAGTGGAARAALLNDSIGFGLALGNLMAQGIALGQPAASTPNYRGSDMSSLNRRVRSTYGQGAPTGRPPPTSESTITGTH